MRHVLQKHGSDNSSIEKENTLQLNNKTKSITTKYVILYKENNAPKITDCIKIS